MPRKRVVMIGGGFGGLTAAQSLRHADVVLIDRTNHHLFQPLLYQVATAALSPGDIAWPLRTIFRRHPNVRVVMDEVLSIDRAARLVRLRDSAPILFDALIVAPGSRHSYFGHDAWEQSAPGLKNLADGVRIGGEFIRSTNVIWAAGNRASPLLASLAVPQDGSYRITVQQDLTIPGDPWIFVIGDAANSAGPDGIPLPGLAPVAMQQGRYVATLIQEQTAPERRHPFRYADRGMLATIGRAKAVAQIGRLHFSGLIAWLLWCVVHIFFLIGLRNRVRVISEWMWYFVTFKPGARVIYDLPKSTCEELKTSQVGSAGQDQ